MKVAKTPMLYTQIVDITEDYLGPAAKRFIDRQIENHLHKKPEDVTKRDLKTLNNWMVSMVAMLTEDKKIITEYTNRLDTLSGSKN